MAENYECIDDPKSGVNAPPPVPPPAPPPGLTNAEPGASKGTGTQVNISPVGNSQLKPPPPLNEKPSQERSQEAIPAAPRLVGNPLSGGFFEGYNSGNIDTPFDYVPEYLTDSRYVLKEVQFSIIPPDFHVLFNGVKYDCAKGEIIKLYKLTPVYTFFDHIKTDQYITDIAVERNLKRVNQRTQ